MNHNAERSSNAAIDEMPSASDSSKQEQRFLLRGLGAFREESPVIIRVSSHHHRVDPGAYFCDADTPNPRAIPSIPAGTWNWAQGV